MPSIQDLSPTVQVHCSPPPQKKTLDCGFGVQNSYFTENAVSLFELTRHSFSYFAKKERVLKIYRMALERHKKKILSTYFPKYKMQIRCLC